MAKPQRWLGAVWGRGKALTSVTMFSAARYKSVTLEKTGTWIRHGAQRPVIGKTYVLCSCVCITGGSLSYVWHLSHCFVNFFSSSGHSPDIRCCCCHIWKSMQVFNVFQTTITESGQAESGCLLVRCQCLTVPNSPNNLQWSKFRNRACIILRIASWEEQRVKHQSRFWCFFAHLTCICFIPFTFRDTLPLFHPEAVSQPYTQGPHGTSLVNMPVWNQPLAVLQCGSTGRDEYTKALRCNVTATMSN